MRHRYLRWFAVLAVAGCPAALMAQPNCSIQDVVGTWAVQGQGTMLPTLPGATAPIAVPGADIGIAYIDFDRTVTLTVTGITARSGAAAAQTLSGSFTVNPDCTAIATAPTPIPGFTFKEQFVILNQGNEMWTLALNGLSGKPAVWQCHWTKISPVPWPASAPDWYSNCSTGLARGTWVGRYDGVLLPFDPSARMPLGVVLMGGVTHVGELEGSLSTSLSGKVSAGTFATKITQLNLDCTGTWTVTLTGADGAPLPGGGVEQFIMLDGGKEIWTISAEGVAGTPVGTGRWRQISSAEYR